MNSQEDRAFQAFRQCESKASLVRLLESFHPRIFDLCHQVLGHLQDAEDAAQHVLLEAVEYVGRMPSAAAFRSWLFRVCLSRSLDLRRKQLRRHGHESKLPAGSGETNGDHDPGDEERRLLLLRAIEKLADSDRTLLLQHYFEATPLSALALRHACSKVAIWKKLERIRHRLKESLNGIGLAGAVPLFELLLARPTPAPRPTGLGPAVLARVGNLPGAISSAPGGAWVSLKAAASGSILVVGSLLFFAGLATGLKARPGEAITGGDSEAANGSRRAAGSLNSVRPSGGTHVAPPAETSSARIPDPIPAKVANVQAGSLDKVRMLLRSIRRQRVGGKPAPLDPSIDLEAFMVTLAPILTGPSARPEAYAEFLQALYQVAADEYEVPLTEAQQETAGRLGEKLIEACRAASTAPAFERRLRELEADLIYRKGMADILRENVADPLVLVDIDRITKRGSRKSQPAEMLVNSIVDDWEKIIEPDPAYRTLLESAAGKLVAALERLTGDFRTRYGVSYDEDEFVKNLVDRKVPFAYTPERRLEYQILALKAQLEALETFRHSLTADQQRRLAEADLWNYAVSRGGQLIERRQKQ